MTFVKTSENMTKEDIDLCNLIAGRSANKFFDAQGVVQSKFWKSFFKRKSGAKAYLLCLGINEKTKDSNCIDVLTFVGKEDEYLKVKEYLFDNMHSIDDSRHTWTKRDKENATYDKQNDKWLFWLIKDKECITRVKKWLITKSLE